MNDVFLSASVPLPERDRKFFETADVLSIREAIKSLVEVVLPVGRITCGGHPAITPLLALFARDAGLERERVTIFQSDFFHGQMPSELRHFIDVQIVPAVDHDRSASLHRMRERMIGSRAFIAGVFIGGMEGVIEEFNMFVRQHPKAIILPIASTGAAAEAIYASGQFDPQFRRDLTYASLFRRRLPLNQRPQQN